ncbi:tRNA pseudouridine(38-40) synthase TruA [Pseudodesulfovibrio sediminis]|uniref:tRNA pseudouridine synthase A n=1 Tax=Pseudodesulfovibrio sediminis TaxID=2810563 RepID=A0ABN6EQ82_9BACT|nr:tRNA pseudouridine(38-40) synthase TruA [Pseudodesulfovibrio sediminis]BCS88583.1 tRNA pseudouridine synthase A [Pseudodesulfovibrio sediminis]
MIRIKLILAYDGTEYCGWQIQPNGPTVQAELEKALAKILGTAPRVHGSGRTDAGVHALGLAVHFDCANDRHGIQWQRGLNSLLPPDIRVVDCAIVPNDFHVRYSHSIKTYEYTLWHKREFCLPQRSRYVWQCGAVDFVPMEEAARVLVGEHDFSAFQNMGTVLKTSVRNLMEISRHPGGTEYESVWRFTANGFLKQMVRNLMGCLVACGRGRMTPEDVKRILDSKDRTQAPATVPPQGLTLVRVDYPE